MPPTTAAVADRPTARGPTPVPRPARQPIAATAEPKQTALNSPPYRSPALTQFCTCRAIVTSGKPKPRITVAMPSRPARSSTRVITGITSIAAIIRGSTSMVIGSSPIVIRASISSFTFMVPISAAKAEPVRPARITAASSGPKFAQQADRDQVGDEDVGAEPPHRHRRLERQDQADQIAEQQHQRQRAHAGLIDVAQQVGHAAACAGAAAAGRPPRRPRR